MIVSGSGWWQKVAGARAEAVGAFGRWGAVGKDHGGAFVVGFEGQHFIFVEIAVGPGVFESGAVFGWIVGFEKGSVVVDEALDEVVGGGAEDRAALGIVAVEQVGSTPAF